MSHNFDPLPSQDDFDSSLRYLKQHGFLNLWGGKILEEVGILYASVGNHSYPVEIQFKAKEGDLERLQKIMEEVKDGFEPSSTDGQTDS